MEVQVVLVTKLKEFFESVQKHGSYRRLKVDQNRLG